MKNISISLLAIFLLFLSGCKKVKTPDAAIERENWIASFSDSVAYYKEKSAEVETRLSNLQSELANELENFDYIKKPREVSGYYLLKGWSDKLPFTSTALYARINENEKLELIATLAGNTFNRIQTGNFYSEIVPHDQAFNYRHERFNTVYFAGGKADTIAEYIAGRVTDKVNIQYIEGNKKTNFLLPQNEKEMISRTWNLYATQMKVKRLQKELWLYSRKIDTFRRMMDSQTTTEE